MTAPAQARQLSTGSCGDLIAGRLPQRVRAADIPPAMRGRSLCRGMPGASSHSKFTIGACPHEVRRVPERSDTAAPEGHRKASAAAGLGQHRLLRLAVRSHQAVAAAVVIDHRADWHWKERAS
jgi:hypothetical protein